MLLSDWIKAWGFNPVAQHLPLIGNCIISCSLFLFIYLIYLYIYIYIYIYMCVCIYFSLSLASLSVAPRSPDLSDQSPPSRQPPPRSLPQQINTSVQLWNIYHTHSGTRHHPGSLDTTTTPTTTTTCNVEIQQL